MTEIIYSQLHDDVDIFWFNHRAGVTTITLVERRKEPTNSEGIENDHHMACSCKSTDLRQDALHQDDLVNA